MTIGYEEDELEDALAPYSEHIELDEPVKNYLSFDEIYGYAVRSNMITQGDELQPHHIEDWLMNVNEGISEHDEERFHIDENGVYQNTYYNPNGKWDWWAIGGRWDGFFIDSNNKRVNLIRKKDLNLYNLLEENRKELSNIYDREIERYRTGQIDKSYIKIAYNIDPDKPKEDYLNSARLYTCAALKDGMWYEPDNSFHITNEWIDTFSKILESADDDDLLVLIDCHT